MWECLLLILSIRNCIHFAGLELKIFVTLTFTTLCVFYVSIWQFFHQLTKLNQKAIYHQTDMLFDNLTSRQGSASSQKWKNRACRTLRSWWAKPEINLFWMNNMKNWEQQRDIYMRWIFWHKWHYAFLLQHTKPGHAPRGRFWNFRNFFRNLRRDNTHLSRRF